MLKKIAGILSMMLARYAGISEEEEEPEFVEERSQYLSTVLHNAPEINEMILHADRVSFFDPAPNMTQHIEASGEGYPTFGTRRLRR